MQTTADSHLYRTRPFASALGQRALRKVSVTQQPGPVGTFVLTAEATRHHGCVALPWRAFISEKNLLTVTMTRMAVSLGSVT
jgi:hypothetical protein